MKRTFFYVTFLLLLPLVLVAQTQIDTIYSTPNLDGGIYLNSISHKKSIDTIHHYFGVGVYGDMIEGGLNLGRGYLDFDLLGIPQNIANIEAILFIYQYMIRDIPEGDTLFCIVDHINYGNNLDTLDWSAGDPGDYQTLHPKIGILSQDTIVEYKTMDITNYICKDLNSGRHKTQFRISFDIQQPDDKFHHCIWFGAGELYPQNGAPYLVIKYEIDTGIEDNSSTIPAEFRLHQNYPNPFNAMAVFHYDLPQKGIVMLQVFNVTGREVKRLVDKEQPTGSYDVTFDAGDLPSGIYLYRLTLVTLKKISFTDCKKMILIK